MRTSAVRDSSRLEKGQGLAEYALILVLVAVVVIVILSSLGGGVAQVLCRINVALGAGCGECTTGTATGIGGGSAYVTFEAGVAVEASAQSAANIVNMLVLDPSSGLAAQDNDQSPDKTASVSFTTGEAGQYQFYVATASSPGNGTNDTWTLTYSGC